MTEHAYDRPDIGAREFLIEVMRDQSVHMDLRMWAAWLIDHPGDPRFPADKYADLHPGEPAFTIRIDASGIPGPLFTPEQNQSWLERCQRYGLDPMHYH